MMMSLSKSQTIRIKKSYLKLEVKGLIAKKRGKPSPNKISDDLLANAASIIFEKYYDFGPTFACDYLKEKQNINKSK
jgi:hypothetical protein